MKGLLQTLRDWRSPSPSTDGDLGTLLEAADARAPRPERHLWLIRLAEWLRRPLATLGLLYYALKDRLG